MEGGYDERICKTNANLHILTTWGERAAQNRHLLTILNEWCQDVMTYGHLMTEDLPYKPLYLRPGSLGLAPGSKYSGLIGTIHIILMIADDVACSARNPRPATVFNNRNQHINVYGDDIEVDYRGYEVTVESFIRLLTGRVHDAVPRSKRLLSDEASNVFIYLTGHGGDGFLKFQDSEELTSYELADAFEQMWQKGRYNELLLLVDTCQAESLYKKLYSPNIISATSSLIGEDSLSHHDDPTLGVHVIDSWTYYILQYLEGVDQSSSKSLQDFFKGTSDPFLVKSTPNTRTDLFRRDPAKTLLTDFLGSVHTVHFSNETLPMVDECWGCTPITEPKENVDITHSHQYVDQMPPV